MTLAERITALAATTDAVQWMASVLPSARTRLLSTQDLARIDGYIGPAADLHEMLRAILPLHATVWYETTVTAQHGTVITMGYLAAPADDGLDLGWCAMGPARIIGPIGPVRATDRTMIRPDDLTEEAWRESRVAASILIRALLLGL